MKNIDLLYKAYKIAEKAHSGQVDKAGVDYIYHPIRVSKRFPEHDYESRIVALLHDVLEDSSMTAEDLANEGIPKHLVNAVVCMTRKPGEEYSDFIRRCCSDIIAARVKREDLNDNLDITRLKEIDEEDVARLNKYLRAREFLEKTIPYLICP